MKNKLKVLVMILGYYSLSLAASHGTSSSFNKYVDNSKYNLAQKSEKVDFLEKKIKNRKPVFKKSSLVGDNPATYAPSEAENMLSRLIGELEILRDGLAKLRMEKYSIFREYFERSDENEINK